MAEGLNHWTFVWAAYAVTALATALLIGASLHTMRSAEARRDKAREP